MTAIWVDMFHEALRFTMDQLSVRRIRNRRLGQVVPDDILSFARPFCRPPHILFRAPDDVCAIWHGFTILMFTGKLLAQFLPELRISQPTLITQPSSAE